MYYSPKNQSLVLYTLASLSSLIFFIGWGLVFNSNIYILTLGIFLIGLFSTLLIEIKYPQSLTHKNEKIYTFFTYFYENRGIIKSTIFVLFVYAFITLGVPMLLFCDAMAFVLHTPGFLIAFQWMYLICGLTLSYVYRPNLLQTKIKLNKALYSYGNRKIFLFFRLHPKALKDPVPLFLGLLTLVANTPFVLFFVGGLSFRYHYGIEAYFLVVLYISITFLITLPVTRRYLFSTYGDKSLKLLGWNGPIQDVAKAAGTLLVISGTVITIGILNREAGRVDQERQIAHDERIRKQYSRNIEQARLDDPQGHAQGKYPYPQPSYPPSTNNIGREGGEVVRSAGKK